MKKGLLALVFTIYSVFCFGTQCGPITFTTQAEINAFVSNNPGCDSIMGNLTITSSLASNDISDLSSLSVIKYIQNKLTIADLPNLAILSGLEGLEHVEEVDISRNPLLSDVNALENMEIGRYLTIIENPLLLQCCAFSPAILAIQIKLPNEVPPAVTIDDKLNGVGCQSVLEILADTSCLPVASAPSSAVPTLGQWALIQLGLILMIIGIVAVQQSRPASTVCKTV